jgi:UV DNA damage endonuclease
MIEMLKWNHFNGIKHYRMSSDMFPHYTDPVTETYTMDFATDVLQEAGRVASELGHRITAHPGEFVQIGAKDPQIFQKSYEELQMHADIMNTMGVSEEEGILCIHGGGMYGDKENTIRRWIDQFDDLPGDIQRRIVIEHCEKCYSLSDVLYIAEETNIPVIFDNLHYECYLKLHPSERIDPPEELLPQVVEGWKSRGVNPVFHLAQQKQSARFFK